jgi:uridine kinase
LSLISVNEWRLIFICRRRADIPIYSFAKHAREKETTSIYSPHVLILEGILALYDPRVLELLDMKVSNSSLTPSQLMD